ncbi:SWI/SNF-related matrix-associated actin-dependent regulator of chromatin subfamily E member 1-related isoform X2 [Amia ocellicauda]|uniref:SWI/SNF-related matrix-associated actin-dependent regulator of chromatin subfamily E member 1-related isoform X2 n=1 Tax=Amia ocellicauda TaxID=2972642 RepID=UPI0034646BD2
MNLDSCLNPALTTGAMTVVSPAGVTSIPGYDLTTVQHLQSEETGALSENAAGEEGAIVGLSGSSNAGDGSPDPAAFIDGVPVTVSVQHVDGQQRILCVTTDASGSTVSYVGQLNTDANLELQAEVPSQPLLSDDGLTHLPPGAQLVPIHPLTSALQPLHNIILDGQQEEKQCDTKETKKRKGGWPKGKKRKPPKEFSAPRAPTTGYVIFINERKVQLKMDHPDLPFTEITKMLGIQWSQLSLEEKQKYNNAAETDKQRYITELKAYQNSEAYKAFLKRKALNKVKNVCGIESVDAEMENEVFVLSQIDGDENSDLYCRTCNQYFSSLHNKKEHLMGKQHLQNLTEEFEKETVVHSKEQEEELAEEDSEEETDLAQLCGLASQDSLTSLDLSLLEEFLVKQMKLREFELHELSATLEKEMEKHTNLNKQLQELQKQKTSLETDLENLKVYGGTLESQLDSLKMVPLLFQFHIQIIDSEAECGH